MVTATRTTANRLVPGRVYFVEVDGSAYELDEEQVRLFRDVIAHASSDCRMMTTAEMARLLRVSPKTVGCILDSGVIPFKRDSRTGQRTVMADDVLRFKRESERRRRSALENMRDAAEEIGMYDTPDEYIPFRTR
ncbi:helix-turn-helix domain-containing protein [Bifidobacterium saguinibicoloris]|uniref:helix-turn-helix domain-containing protein n=1 Tax=Bifidobacterium saguinibicoloris TaxID=2834433 RepID=UPI001C55C7C6|nr:helix-turn-helix domain-containing protein [Bifidobacterium saguinibicoloris]MBW3081496.1 helix-turn-helix domain-containing protein [Bifidobacterium saguinibicoloris]